MSGRGGTGSRRWSRVRLSVVPVVASRFQLTDSHTHTIYTVARTSHSFLLTPQLDTFFGAGSAAKKGPQPESWTERERVKQVSADRRASRSARKTDAEKRCK